MAVIVVVYVVVLVGAGQIDRVELDPSGRTASPPRKEHSEIQSSQLAAESMHSGGERRKVAGCWAMDGGGGGGEGIGQAELESEEAGWLRWVATANSVSLRIPAQSIASGPDSRENGSSPPCLCPSQKKRASPRENVGEIGVEDERGKMIHSRKGDDAKGRELAVEERHCS